MRDLFTKIQSPEHCLYPLLPPKRGRSNRHRPKGHDYELPNCTYNFHKQSFVINCLFRFLYWFYIACIHTALCVYICYMLSINTLTLKTTDNSRPLLPHSKSFKVIDFCCNRKPIYDFLLVINYLLSSILHRFRDTASRSRKPPHPNLSPPFEGSPSNFVIKLGRQRVKALGYILLKTT